MSSKSSSAWLKYRRGNRFIVSFPTLPSLTVQPSEVDLYQERSSHDILEITYIRESSLWPTLIKTGLPVTFTWIQGSRKKIWTGYVNHISSQSAAQRERLMKIVCVGASYRLKKRANRNWNNKTVTEVASIIARENKFKFVGEPSKRRFEQLSMTGQSYWSWLQEYAAKIGYAFYVENTTMYLRPLNKLLTESASNAPIMGLEIPAPAANVKAWDRTLDSFVVQRGDYFDGAETLYTVKTTAGVNPLTGKKLSSSSSPTEDTAASTRTGLRTPIFEDFPEEVVHTSSFSKQTAKDLAFAAKFVIPAKLRGQGDPRIRPFAAVYVLNTSKDTDGYWAVNKVHHAFNITGLYEVEMDLVTDGIGPNSTATFRKAVGLRQGTIDVDSLVSSNQAKKSLTQTTRLISKRPSIKETEQGFAESSAIWSDN